MSRPLLILDVDETLVRATDPDWEPGPPRVDFHVGPIPVMKRPHVDDFLRWSFASPIFETAVWSAGGEDYVRGVLSQLLRPEEMPAFVFTHARCTRYLLRPEEFEDSMGRQYDDRRYIDLKDLKKVRAKGYMPERVLALDDNAGAWRRSYGNHVPIRPFVGDVADEELQRVRPHLERWLSAPDVRRIDKRGW